MLFQGPVRYILLNDIFTELDGSSGIKNVITDRLNLLVNCQ